MPYGVLRTKRGVTVEVFAPEVFRDGQWQYPLRVTASDGTVTNVVIPGGATLRAALASPTTPGAEGGPRC